MDTVAARVRVRSRFVIFRIQGTFCTHLSGSGDHSKIICGQNVRF